MEFRNHKVPAGNGLKGSGNIASDSETKSLIQLMLQS